MENNEITKGKIISLANKKYTIVFINKDIVTMCELNTSKINIIPLTTKQLLDYIMEGSAIILEPFKLQNFKQNIELDDESQKRIQMIEEFNQHYYPKYLGIFHSENRQFNKDLKKKYKLSNNKFLRLIRKYLQSGLNNYSLLDERIFAKKENVERNYKRKPGARSKYGDVGIPLSKEIYEIFEEYRQYFMKGQFTTIQSAYDKMIYTYFTEVKETENGIVQVVMSKDKKPSFKQFYNYITTRCDTKSILTKVKGETDFRNNHRLLLSDSLYGNLGPMSVCEMDECEFDISLVSATNKSIVVGRPIVYTIIDNYSRMIIAYCVTFENNSYKGATSCLLSLLEDKVELCRKYNFTITRDRWPSRVLPLKLRVDYGAEYAGVTGEELFARLGITRELVSPATGSLKGIVESLFHEFQLPIKTHSQNKGLIRKDNTRNNHKNATMNINEFEKVIVEAIAAHNSKYLENYPVTPDMISKNIEPKPYILWNYGCENCGYPRPIHDDLRFKFDLLLPIDAKISRKGIVYKDLFYFNYTDPKLEDECLSQGNRSKKMDNVRFDPRDMSNLYYMRDGEIYIAPLIIEKNGMEQYLGMNYTEYMQLRAIKKAMDNKGKIDNEELRIALSQRTENNFKNSKKSKEKLITKDISNNRRIEKRQNENEKLIMKGEIPQIENKALQDDKKAISFSDLDNKLMNEVNGTELMKLLNKEEE